MVIGAPSGSDRMYAATPTVTALPARCARRLARTVKCEVWRVRMWVTPPEVREGADEGALDCAEVMGKGFASL